MKALRVRVARGVRSQPCRGIQVAKSPVPVEGPGTNARRDIERTSKEDTAMLETIAIILIVLWLLGMVSGYTMGNFIYVLLVIAIVLFLVRLVSGRRVV
jgi:uncharacterized protein DUF5670